MRIGTVMVLLNWLRLVNGRKSKGIVDNRILHGSQSWLMIVGGESMVN